MEMMFRSKRIYVAVVLGKQDEEDDSFAVISNTGGDFSPAPVEEYEPYEEDSFGFRGTGG